MFPCAFGPGGLDIVKNRNDLRIAELVFKGRHIAFVARRECAKAVLSDGEELPVRVMPGVAR